MLAVSLPLAVARAPNIVIQFCERHIFLGAYSFEALAAVTPATQAAFLGTAFSLSAGNYLGVFVVQYVVIGRSEGVGAVLRSSGRFSFLAGLPLGVLGPAAGPLLVWVGHPPEGCTLEGDICVS